MARGQNQNSYIPLNSRIQAGIDGAPLMLKSELLYHPELRGWSLDGPRIHKTRTPQSA